MKLLIRIVQVVVAMIGAIVIGFYLYQFYKPKQIDPYRQANPYLYDRKYYNVPTEEQLRKLIDELTNYDQNYDHNFYIKKAKFSPSSLTGDGLKLIKQKKLKSK